MYVSVPWHDSLPHYFLLYIEHLSYADLFFFVLWTWSPQCQHKKDVQYSRENSAVVNHVMEQKHTFYWERVTCLEKETRKIQRKIIEGCYIRANLDKCVNLNEGMGISAQYKGREGAWIRRGRIVTRYQTSVAASRMPRVSRGEISLNVVFLIFDNDQPELVLSILKFYLNVLLFWLRT